MVKVVRIFFLMMVWLSALACSKGFDSPGEVESPSQVLGGDPNPPPITEPPILPPPTEPFVFEPLAWEAVKPASKPWSQFVFTLLGTEAKDLLLAQDWNRFCARFPDLNSHQKINVAGQLIAGIVKFESGFNPLNRFQESTMGTDPITGQPVWSEGLMQLSYQDIQGYPFCQFDWNQDEELNPTDPQKTILDPFKNLYCGMRILAQQVKRKGRIVIDSGAYWAVIKENGRFEKINEIAAIVSRLKVCR
jgi:hypothetical protein